MSDWDFDDVNNQMLIPPQAEYERYPFVYNRDQQIVWGKNHGTHNQLHEVVPRHEFYGMGALLNYDGNAEAHGVADYLSPEMERQALDEYAQGLHQQSPLVKTASEFDFDFDDVIREPSADGMTYIASADPDDKWAYLDGHVGFGQHHHQIIEQMAGEAGLNDFERRQVANHAMVNRIPANLPHQIAWGHMERGYPAFWRSNIDRNHVWDVVNKAHEAINSSYLQDKHPEFNPPKVYPVDDPRWDDGTGIGAGTDGGIQTGEHDQPWSPRTSANGGTAFNYVAKGLGGEVQRGAGIDGVDQIMMPDGTRVELRLQMQKYLGVPTLYLVWVQCYPQKTGLGTQVMNLLKQYADQTGLKFQVHLPADHAHSFYDRFDWLDHPSHYDYNYVPPKTASYDDDPKMQQFFEDAGQGLRAPSQGLGSEDLPSSPEDQAFRNVWLQHAGPFDQHIETSIPGYAKNMARKGVALTQAFPGASVLDLAAGHGSFGKALSQYGGMQTTNVDAAPHFREQFEQNPVEGASFGQYSLSEPFINQHGQTVEQYPAESKHDVVHEAMGFQFYSQDRGRDVAQAKAHLNPGGLAIFDEKFIHKNDHELEARNEALKNGWKLRHFPQEALDAKNQEVGLTDQWSTGMRSMQADQGEFEQVLQQNFAHVAPYWKSGNFAGYAASDSPTTLQRFLSAYSPAEAQRAAHVATTGGLFDRFRQQPQQPTPATYDRDSFPMQEGLHKFFYHGPSKRVHVWSAPDEEPYHRQMIHELGWPAESTGETLAGRTYVDPTTNTHKLDVYSPQSKYADKAAQAVQAELARMYPGIQMQRNSTWHMAEINDRRLDELVERAHHEDGFTVDGDLADLPPGGFYTAYAGGQEIPIHQFGPGDIAQVQSTLNPGDLIGAWLDRGTLYLDRSRRFESKDQALQFGADQGQLSIYDANAGQVIPVPGSGWQPEEPAEAPESPVQPRAASIRTSTFMVYPGDQGAIERANKYQGLADPTQTWSGYQGAHRFLSDGQHLMIEPEEVNGGNHGGGHSSMIEAWSPANGFPRDPDYTPSRRKLMRGWLVPTKDGQGYGLGVHEMGLGTNPQAVEGARQAAEQHLGKPTHTTTLEQMHSGPYAIQPGGGMIASAPEAPSESPGSFDFEDTTLDQPAPRALTLRDRLQQQPA